MLIIRLLRQMTEDLLADPRFKGCQFLSFERQERNGVRIFGAANGVVWLQINTLLVGPENSNSCAFIDRYLLIVYMNECSSDCFEYNGEQAIQEGHISFLGLSSCV